MSEKDFNLFSQDSRLTDHEVEKKINVIHHELHNHIRELRADFSTHVKEQSDRYEEMVAAQQLNTQALIKLTKSTEGLVEAWNAGSGVVKVATLLGRFVLWVSVTSAALAGVLHWLGMEFPKR